MPMVPGSFHTLDPDRQKPDLGQRIALIQDPQHIVDRRTGAAGNNANGSREFGNGLFMSRIKKALGI